MEHHSNIVPWQLACEDTGARLRYLSVGDGGELSLDELDAVLAEGHVKLVAVAHVSNVLGTINPVAEIARPRPGGRARSRWSTARRRCRRCRSTWARSTPTSTPGPATRRSARPPACCTAGASCSQEMRPFLGGGHMISRVERDHSTWNELPWKFEAGTNAIAEAIGLGAAIDYLAADRDGAGARARARADRLRAGAAARGRGHHPVRARDLERRGGVVPFTIEGMHPHDIAELCDREAVCVRAGHHCAQPLMRCLGVGATARASFHVYNVREDVDRLVHALGSAREVFDL